MAAPAVDLLRRGLLRLPHRPCPSLLCIPGLYQQPFYNLEDLPPTLSTSLSALASQAPSLLKDYTALKHSHPQGDYSDEGEHKLHSGSWTWHSAIQRGQWSADFGVQAPLSTSLIGSIPGLMTGGLPWAYAFFSNMKPGSEISPHFGPTNTRLRVHIPLTVPTGDIGIECGGERREWVVGTPLVFDDSFVHKTWNKTKEERVVLLLDVWHPSLSLEEREDVEKLFQRAKKEGWLK